MTDSRPRKLGGYLSPVLKNRSAELTTMMMGRTTGAAAVVTLAGRVMVDGFDMPKFIREPNSAANAQPGLG